MFAAVTLGNSRKWGVLSYPYWEVHRVTVGGEKWRTLLVSWRLRLCHTQILEQARWYAADLEHSTSIVTNSRIGRYRYTSEGHSRAMGWRELFIQFKWYVSTFGKRHCLAIFGYLLVASLQTGSQPDKKMPVFFILPAINCSEVIRSLNGGNAVNHEGNQEYASWWRR